MLSLIAPKSWVKRSERKPLLRSLSEDGTMMDDGDGRMGCPCRENGIFVSALCQMAWHGPIEIVEWSPEWRKIRGVNESRRLA